MTDPLSIESDPILRSHLQKAGYQTVALIPVKSGDQIAGILQLYDHRKDLFSQEDIRFLEDIGATIGVAVKRMNKEIENIDAKQKAEEFRQVSEGYNRNYEGTGLGLSIVNQLMILYGGNIHVESEPGRGSAFTVTLPVFKKSPDHESETQIDEKDPLTEGRFPDGTDLFRKSNGEPVRILVVEDNEDNVEIIKIHLNLNGSMEVADDAGMALRMVATKQFDMILMDINLGAGMNGMEATRKIRKLSGYESTPVIALTGYTLAEDKTRIFEAGCTHYLGKPFTKSELLRVVREASQNITLYGK